MNRTINRRRISLKVLKSSLKVFLEKLHHLLKKQKTKNRKIQKKKANNKKEESISDGRK